MSFAPVGIACQGGTDGATANAQSVPAAASQDAPQGQAASAAACGEKGQPDCPLQGWMKANLQSQLRARDFPRLESALAELAGHGQAPYDGWLALAKGGAEAAAAQDMAGVRKACKGCHDEHRDRFREEMRTATAVVPN